MTIDEKNNMRRPSGTYTSVFVMFAGQFVIHVCQLQKLRCHQAIVQSEAVLLRSNLSPLTCRTRRY